MTRYSEPPLILPGSAATSLVGGICDELGIKPGGIEISSFSDGETHVQIQDNVRGRDVFVIQPTSRPTNQNLMELLLILDAARRASADRITAVMPYFGYARQDRKERGRVPISAKLVANLITTAGAQRVVAVDLHSGQLQGFFDLPLDHLEARPLLARYVKSLGLENVCVVSPDVGNVKASRDFADRLGFPLAIIDKRRPRPNEAEVMSIIGLDSIKDRNVLIIDDMIDTAGTICNAAAALRDAGARDVYALATHGVFSGPALERLSKAPLTQVVVTNTIDQVPHDALPNLKIISVAPLLAKAIDRIHQHTSVSDLFSSGIV